MMFPVPSGKRSANQDGKRKLNEEYVCYLELRVLLSFYKRDTTRECPSIVPSNRIDHGGSDVGRTLDSRG